MKTQPQNDYKQIYIDWLTKKINQVEITENIQRITLPFLDHNNDHIEFYIINEGLNKFTITDDGSTINELELSNVDVFSSPRRKAILTKIINAHGVELFNNNELRVHCTMDNLPHKKHMLAQCIMKISDMYYLSRATVQSLFLEDVKTFLLDNDIQFTQDVSFVGKSKLTTHYDFVIGQTKRRPERVITTINNLDINIVRNILFSWNDTKEVRHDAMEIYTFIQDADKKINMDHLSALNEYDVKPVLWSEKEKYIGELAA
jgi:hypothetical protein